MTHKPKLYITVRIPEAKKEGSLRRPKLAVVSHLQIFHVRSWRHHERVSARCGFGSRTAVHSTLSNYSAAADDDDDDVDDVDD